MRNAMLLAFAVGTVTGLVIAVQVGWPVLALGLVSLATAYFYSAGPRPMAYVGLGEVLVFTFLGAVIMEGSYYVQTHQWSTTGLWLAAPLGLWATCILVLNDIRDRERDRGIGKLTLAVRVGRRWSERELAVLIFASYGLVAASVLLKTLPTGALLGLLTLPSAVRLVRVVRSGVEGKTLTGLQGVTTLHYVNFSVLLATGIALGGRF